MTLSRPIPDAVDAAQQRLELELLLRRHVLSPDELNKGLSLATSLDNGMDLDGWKAIPAIPVSLDEHHLAVAVPSHWEGPQGEELVSRLSKLDREIVLQPALQSDLEAAWTNSQSASNSETQSAAASAADAAGISETDESSSQDVEETAAS